MVDALTMPPLPDNDPVQPEATTFDKKIFHKEFPLMALRIPITFIGQIKQKCSSILLNWARVKKIHPCAEQKDHRLMLLAEGFLSFDDVLHALETDQAKDFIKVLKESGCELEEFPLVIDYAYRTADECLQVLLPKDVQGGSSFETIGHIAHTNLRDNLMPYRYIIGPVIADKNPQIKVVVTKTGTIETKFRTFPMEVIGGDKDASLVTEVKENGCRFVFDFSKVYWNSRLHTEHTRIIAEFGKTERICDVMAGVGPFALPAAKKGCDVWANDLNPESFQALENNAVLNKVKNIKLFNEDGRDFIRDAVSKLWKEQGHLFQHFVMNLPAMALEFLDAFKPVFEGLECDFGSDYKPPLVHVYCFTRKPEETVEAEVIGRAESYLGKNITKFTLHFVRKVAPNKDMYCLSFELPRFQVEPVSKRRRVEED